MASTSYEQQANAIRQIKQRHKRAASLHRAATNLSDEDYTSRRVPTVSYFIEIFKERDVVIYNDLIGCAGGDFDSDRRGVLLTERRRIRSNRPGGVDTECLFLKATLFQGGATD
jgi:hypothetical protein